MKLLIADTNQSMLNMTATWLKSLGHEIASAETTEQMRQHWKDLHPDIVIISTCLSDEETLTICKEIQNDVDALILALDDNADAGIAIQNEIQWLEAGADDYLRKPFYPDQLLAHIHALGRRVRTTRYIQLQSIIQAATLSIDLLHNEVQIRHKTIRLTPTESKILHFLACNAGKVCTYQKILNYVWGCEIREAAALIKPHVYNLRQKIEDDPQKPDYILTIPYTGYMLTLNLVSREDGTMQKSS